MDYYIKVLQNYANFEGRAARKEFWYFILFDFLISSALWFVTAALDIELLIIIRHWTVEVLTHTGGSGWNLQESSCKAMFIFS